MKQFIDATCDADMASETDNEESVCSGADNDSASLPRYARLPINRCNVPAVILGSLTFQRFPTPLHLDSVAELHADLFRRLARIADAGDRAETFRDCPDGLISAST